MENYLSVEVQETFNWEMCDYDQYITGYKLFKQLKNKWHADEHEETSGAI